jgi:hypothetical protein
MDKLARMRKDVHLSEGIKEWITQTPFGLGKLTYGLTAKDSDT